MLWKVHLEEVVDCCLFVVSIAIPNYAVSDQRVGLSSTLSLIHPASTKASASLALTVRLPYPLQLRMLERGSTVYMLMISSTSTAGT